MNELVERYFIKMAPAGKRKEPLALKGFYEGSRRVKLNDIS
jgi:hypothetical protein